MDTQGYQLVPWSSVHFLLILKRGFPAQESYGAAGVTVGAAEATPRGFSRENHHAGDRSHRPYPGGGDGTRGTRPTIPDPARADRVVAKDHFELQDFPAAVL